MRIGTLLSVGVLAVSSAALAQVTTAPTKPMPGNNMSMPMNDTMNSADETMMNDSSMVPNSTMPPK